jgi:hypothetical protein
MNTQEIVTAASISLLVILGVPALWAAANFVIELVKIVVSNLLPIIIVGSAIVLIFALLSRTQGWL